MRGGNFKIKLLMGGAIILFAFFTSTVGAETLVPNNPSVGFVFYPYWSSSLWQWEYWWLYQYSNVYQIYPVFKDNRKSLLEGKLLNEGKPLNCKKVFFDKVF